MVIQDMKKTIKLAIAIPYSHNIMRSVKHFYHMGDGTVEETLTTEYKERAARSFAEAILKNWDALVDGPHWEVGEDGSRIATSYLRVQSLKEEE